jgi:hypothetical protein
MDRVIDVARECGYLDGLPEFRRSDSWKSAASATARMRATFDAKVVTATRWGASAISVLRVSRPGHGPGDRCRPRMRLPRRAARIPAFGFVEESASATARMRATFDAKVVTATRWGASAISVLRVSATDPTPVAGSVTSPEAFTALGDEGVLAIVCDSTNVAMAFDSGMECETGTYSSSNGPTVTRRPGFTSRRGDLHHPRARGSYRGDLGAVA